MAEKNTLSILESIKRKMSKFDQKSKKPEVTFDMKDEFEYIAVDKNAAVAEVKAEAAAPIQNLGKIETPAAPKTASNELNFDELNLDEEIAEMEKGAAPKAASPAAALPEELSLEEDAEEEFEEEFDEEDLEDYEDEVDMEEEYEDEEQQPSDKKAGGTDDLDIDEEEEGDDILNFDDEEEEEEKKPESKKEVVNDKAAEDDFLNFDEEEEEEEEEEEVKKPVEFAAANKADDLDLDEDLNFEELDRKEQEAKKALSDKVLDEKEELEIEEEEEEVEFEEEVAQEIEGHHETTEEEVEEEEGEEFDEDVDLDHDTEVMMRKDQANSVNLKDIPMEDAAASANNQKVDFMEFDLDEESEKPQQTQQQAQFISQQSQVMPPIQKQEASQQPAQAAGSISIMPSNERKKENPVSILSQETVQDASNSIRKLLDANNVISGVKKFSQDPVLSEIAVQLMEPKLEKWLNENLAEIVERIVKEEIKKIVPKV